MQHKQVSDDYLHYGETVTNHHQNLEEQFPQLISELSSICFQAFQKQDESLTCLVYEAHCSHLLQLEASKHALAFPFDILPEMKPPILQIIKRIITLHPQKQIFEFTARHYATVAQRLVRRHSDIFLDNG